MRDPYLVLGIRRSASDVEVKKAYRELVRKYHPDSNPDHLPLEVAEARMKEINEAYDEIVRDRTANNSGGYYNGGGYGGGQSYGPFYAQVRQLIADGALDEASRMLREAKDQDAEWNYLMGSIAYRRGWMDEARQYFETACRMDPGNQEYRHALKKMAAHEDRGYRRPNQTIAGFDVGKLLGLLTFLACLFRGGCR